MTFRYFKLKSSATFSIYINYYFRISPRFVGTLLGRNFEANSSVFSSFISRAKVTICICKCDFHIASVSSGIYIDICGQFVVADNFSYSTLMTLMLPRISVKSFRQIDDALSDLSIAV